MKLSKYELQKEKIVPKLKLQDLRLYQSRSKHEWAIRDEGH